MTPYIKKQLLKNWGDAAEAMTCFCPIKYYDPKGPWQCYVYALNPLDEDEICCILLGETLEITKWSLKELLGCYNNNGDHVHEDEEYMPRRIDEIYKRLYERFRN